MVTPEILHNRTARINNPRLVLAEQDREDGGRPPKEGRGDHPNGRRMRE